MQMWYIHPTLGYRKWFHLTQFIWLPEAIDYSPYPGYNGHDHLNQICNWQASVFNDSKSWDYLLYLSGMHYKLYHRVNDGIALDIYCEIRVCSC